MKGLNPTERSVLEVLIACGAGTGCRDDWCNTGSGSFEPGELKAVWDLVARGLATASNCDCCPGMQHISITPEGLFVLHLVKTAESTPSEKL